MATARGQRRCTLGDCPLGRTGPHFAHDANAKSAALVAMLASHGATTLSNLPGDLLVERAHGAVNHTGGLPAPGDLSHLHAGVEPAPTRSAAATEPLASHPLRSSPFASRRRSSVSGPPNPDIDPALLFANTTGRVSANGSEPEQGRGRCDPSERGSDLDGSGDSDRGAPLKRLRRGAAEGEDGLTQKRKKAAHGQGKKRLARLKATEKSTRLAATVPRTREEQIKSHHGRTETLAHNFKQTCLDNGTFGILLLAHPHHLGRRKTNAMPYYKVVVSNEYESTVSTVPTDRINLSAILSESGASNLELPPFVSPDALVNTIESLFAAHVQQAQAGVYGLGIGRMQMADELVRAANARAEASDKARRKLQRKLDRVLAQVKRHKKKRARQGEESDSSDDLSV